MNTDNSRMNAWRQSQAESGKKRIDLFVNEETHQTLKDIRSETRESYGEIVGRLVATSNDKPGQEVLDGHMAVTIQIPEKDYERLVKEHGDNLESFFTQFIDDSAARFF